MSELVRVITEDQIATVTLNRPEQYNSLTIPMFEAIRDAALSLREDRDIRAVILCGEGKGFCSGLDVPSVIKNPANVYALLKRDETEQVANLAQEVCYLWRTLPVPVIAVTHGVCYGGGLQIALGADFRYSHTECRFSVMESQWGLIPDMGGSICLRELMPIDIAKELTMTGKVIDAAEAKSIHLVTHVSHDPMEDALDFCRTIKERSPDAMSYAKKLFQESWHESEKSALHLETKLQKKVLGRPNHLITVFNRLFKKQVSYRRRPDLTID